MNRSTTTSLVLSIVIVRLVSYHRISTFAIHTWVCAVGIVDVHMDERMGCQDLSQQSYCLAIALGACMLGIGIHNTRVFP